MSDKIDYDALDKAIQAAQRETNQKSTSKSTTKPSTHRAAAKASAPTARPQVKATPANRPVDAKPVAHPVTTPTPQAHPARGRFMDFAAPTKHNNGAAPISVRVTAPKPAVKPTAPRVVSHAPSAHGMPQYHHAPVANTLSPAAAAQIRHRQVLDRKRQLLEQQRRQEILKQRQLARKRAELQAAHEAKLQAAAELEAEQKAQLARSAAAAKAGLENLSNQPDNSSYSIGVRSPFIVNTDVEKRPLGKDVPESDPLKLESSKNVYSQKDPSKPKKSKKDQKHTVVDSPKKTSGWAWTFLAIFIIFAGAALGYFAYVMVFANQM